MTGEQSFRDLAVEDEPEVDLERIEGEISALEAELTVFANPVWDALKGRLETELAGAVAMLIDAPLSSDQIMQVRGRAQALSAAIRIPEAMENEKTQLEAILAEAQRTDDQEGDERAS